MAVFPRHCAPQEDQSGSAADWQSPKSGDQEFQNRTAIGQAKQETRKSSNAGVIVLGSHTLKAYTRKQTIHARSGAEDEVYEAASGASE